MVDLRNLAANAELVLTTARALKDAQVLAPIPPQRLLRMLGALRLGVSPATACALAAARTPDGLAIADDRGILSYAALERQSSALAAALHYDHGIGPGRSLAVMCRNHRGFVQAVLAGARLGADVLLLNTEFPGPQLAQALEKHAVACVVLDQEFEASFDAAQYSGPRVIAWHEVASQSPTVDSLARRAAPTPPRSKHKGKIIILTSGTTGAPKGAPRTLALGAVLGPLNTILSRMQLRAQEPLLVAPPLFHGFGLAYLGLALFLAAPLVLRRKFDPETTLSDIARYRVPAIAVVPVMLKRMLDLPEAVRARHDTSCLRTVISAAAPLSPSLALAFMDVFGEVLFNLYGSTEAGFASLAGPDDLRAAPDSVGRAAQSVTLKILDAERRELPIGERGWIFVGSPLLLKGYSGGGNKELADGLMNTGDMGHLDSAGRLYVEGREDDMIVSGGENVFPQEVEDVLARHPDVGDVAVIGVPDADFGARLRAFVVRRTGQAASEDELKAHVKLHVARYKVPREIVFLSELPRNASGKVLRTRLSAMSPLPVGEG